MKSEKFKEEGEILKMEQLQVVQLQKCQNDLLNEVRTEGQLADFNLALDKHRSNTKAEEILLIEAHISAQNVKLRNQVDEIFLERKGYEDQSFSLESQIHELKDNAEIKINELSIEQREIWKKSEVQLKELETDIKAKKERTDTLNFILSEQEAKLRSDQPRLKALRTKEEVSNLEAKKADLEDKFAENNLTFSELRQKLMEKIKEEKGEIATLEKRSKELKRLVELSQKNILKIDEENRQDSVSEEQRQKYEVLYAKEIELDEKASNFDKIRTEKLLELANLETYNLSLLEAASKYVTMTKLKETVESGDSKQKLIANILQQQDELKKLEEIEESLPERISTMRSSLAQYKKDILHISNSDKERKRLLDETKKMKEYQNKFREEALNVEEKLSKSKEEYNSSIDTLQKHKFFDEFVDCEKRLSQSNQLLYNIQSYIKFKEGEALNDDSLTKILSLADSINKILTNQ